METLPQNVQRTESSPPHPAYSSVAGPVTQPPAIVTPHSLTKPTQAIAGGVRVPLKARMVFFRQWATSIKAGLSLAASLHHLSQTTNNPELREAARKAQICAEGGGKLSAWMRTRPHIFSRAEAALIYVGEVSGSLDTIIDRIATDLEQEQSLHQRLFLATFINKYVVLPLLFLIPNTPNIMMHGLDALDKAGANLSQEEQQGIMLREGLKGYFNDLCHQLVPVLITLMVVYGLYYLLVRTEFGRRWRDKLVLSIPLTGALWRDLAISRYLTALQLLSKAGVAPPPALEACADISGNRFLDEKFQEAARLARTQNLSIASALTRTEIFSPTTLSLLQTGEHTGAMPAMLEQAASYYQTDVQNRMATTPKMVGILCFTICGFATAIIAGRAILLYFNNLFPAVDKFMGIS